MDAKDEYLEKKWEVPGFFRKDVSAKAFSFTVPWATRYVGVTQVWSGVTIQSCNCCSLLKRRRLQEWLGDSRWLWDCESSKVSFVEHTFVEALLSDLYAHMHTLRGKVSYIFDWLIRLGRCFGHFSLVLFSRRVPATTTSATPTSQWMKRDISVCRRSL